MPVGDAALDFVHCHGVTEEHGLAAELHADPHGQCAVDVRFAGGGNALVVEHTEHRAHGGAEGREEIRPAAGSQRADMMLMHIVGICLEQTCMVKAVPVRSLVQTAGASGGLFEICRALLVGVGLCLFDKLARLDGLKLHAEGVHKLAVQCAAEAESLGGMTDGGHGQRAHGLLDARCLNRGFDSRDNGLFLRCAEAPVEAAPVKRAEGVGGGVGTGQGVQAETAPVNDRLAQRPEQHGAVEAAQHLRHICGVGKGQILKYNQVRIQPIQKSTQLIQCQQHFLRAYNLRVNAAQHSAGTLELILCSFQVISGYPHRNINGTERHIGTS